VKIARKEFSGPRAKENFLIENKICRAFHEPKSGIPRVIVTPLFSYVIEDADGNVKYNICFELARCNLKTWLSDDKNFPSGNKVARIANIQRMYELASGLEWLTNTITFENGSYGRQKIIHLDLHWRNILVFEGSDTRDSLIFKIGDFGNATRGRELENRQKSSVPSAAGFHGQFSAPEPKPDERSDVWSFGCNLLLVLVFNYYGVKGINEFLASLLRYSSRDWFYDSKTGAASHETTSCIKHLRRFVENDPDRLVTTKLLVVLQEKILVPLKGRWKISQVVQELRGCLNEQKTVEPKIMVKQRDGPYQHCAHAPQGRFEMFHHHAEKYTMSVWIWNSGMASELPFLEPIAAPQSGQAKDQPKRIYPHSSCCGERHICQVITNSDTLEVRKLRLEASSKY
jgi:serine/threonine protein kinase